MGDFMKPSVDFWNCYFTNADFARNLNCRTEENIFWNNDRDSQSLTIEIHIPGYDKSDVKVSILEEYHKKYLVLKENNDAFKYKTSIPNGYKIPEDCRVENGIFSMKFEKYQDVKEINIL
jgi:hypothetical protein